MAVDPTDMNQIRVDVLGTTVDNPGATWITGGPAGNRNALDSSITERIVTRILNAFNVAIEAATGATSVFAARFNSVVGDEAGPDQAAFDSLGGNLIQALASGGQGSFVFDQPVASTTWSISHNLGRQYCAVQLVSDAGATMLADIDFVDADDLVVTFAIPKAGTAIVRR